MNYVTTVNKISGIMLVLLLLLTVGCTQPATSPQPSPAPTVKPSPTATPEQRFEWKYSTVIPSADYYFEKEAQGPFRQEIESKSKGRIKITPYFASSLGKAQDQPEMVRRGAIDMAYHVVGYTPGLFPTLEITELPFFAITDQMSSILLWELYKKGYFDKEFADFKMLQLWGNPPPDLISRKAVKSIEDFKGLKLRSAGKWQGSTVESVGAAPDVMAVGDVYMAIQKGVMDGAISHAPTFTGYKWHEVAKNYTNLRGSLGATSGVIMMNKGIWEKLPQDLKDVIDLASQHLLYTHPTSLAKAIDAAHQTFAQTGVTEYRLSDSDLAKLATTVVPIWKRWIQELEKAGYPATKVREEAKLMSQRMFGFSYIPELK